MHAITTMRSLRPNTALINKDGANNILVFETFGTITKLKIDKHDQHHVKITSKLKGKPVSILLITIRIKILLIGQQTHTDGQLTTACPASHYAITAIQWLENRGAH